MSTLKQKSDMKRIILAITILTIYLSASAQTSIYSPAKTKPSAPREITSFKTDTEKIQYCLGNYYQQRQSGLMLTIGGGALSTVAVLALQTSPKAMDAGIIMGGVISIVGIGVTFDAEKWLKKASISITPSSLKLTF